MIETKKKIQSFQDLVAWQEGHKLVLMVYRTVQAFPVKEKFGLSNQLTRAVVSVTSNIAEGFSRQTQKEKNSILLYVSWFVNGSAKSITDSKRS